MGKRRKKRKKKAQERAQRKRAEREKKRRTRHQVRRSGKRGFLREAARWPIYECLISRDWQEPRNLVQIVVARRSPATREIVCGVFLVDLGCLGVKDAFASRPFTLKEYKEEMRAAMEDLQPMEEADLNLVAKVIREAVAYAKSLGFRPHPDYRDAAILLEGADPDACDVEVPLGDGTGRPLYFAGPYDDVQAIMRQLERAVGEDGFTYLVPLAVSYTHLTLPTKA